MAELYDTPEGPPAGHPKAKHDTKMGFWRDARWDRPILPSPLTGEVETWQRVSTLAKTLDDTFNLTEWAKRCVGRGIAIKRDLYHRAAVTPLSDRGDWQDICEQAMDAAGASEGRNEGDALHDLAEIMDNMDRNVWAVEQRRFPEQMVKDLDAYIRLLDAAELEVVLIERQVLHEDLHASGAIDRAVRDRKTGKLHILDLKTQKDVTAYGQAYIAIQQAAYATSQWLLPRPWPRGGDMEAYSPAGFDHEVAYIAHVPVGTATAELYTVDLAAGLEAAHLAVEVRKWRNRKNLLAQVPLWSRPANATATSEPEPTPALQPTPEAPAEDAQDLVTEDQMDLVRHVRPANTSDPKARVVLDQLHQERLAREANPVPVGIIAETEKQRNKVRYALRSAPDRKALEALYAIWHTDPIWTPDMSNLIGDKLRMWAGQQPQGDGAPF